MLEKSTHTSKSSVVSQDAKLLLKKSNFLLKITKKILSSKRRRGLVKKHTISDDQDRAIELDDAIDAWTDKGTSLMWEVKTRANIEHRYVCDEDYVKQARHSKFLTDVVKDAVRYARKLNREKFAGFDDWRVPTIQELKTISTTKKSNEYYIKTPLSKNSSYSYISSSSLENSSGIASIMHYSNTNVSNNTKYDNYYLRCVRGEVIRDAISHFANKQL